MFVPTQIYNIGSDTFNLTVTSSGDQGVKSLNQCVCNVHVSWRRHQMEAISALLALCARNSPVTGEFPAQRPVTRSFNVFLDLRLNQQLSKQWILRCFKTPFRPLWRYCHEVKLGNDSLHLVSRTSKVMPRSRWWRIHSDKSVEWFEMISRWQLPITRGLDY